MGPDHIRRGEPPLPAPRDDEVIASPIVDAEGAIAIGPGSRPSYPPTTSARVPGVNLDPGERISLRRIQHQSLDPAKPIRAPDQRQVAHPEGRELDRLVDREIHLRARDQVVRARREAAPSQARGPVPVDIAFVDCHFRRGKPLETLAEVLGLRQPGREP